MGVGLEVKLKFGIFEVVKDKTWCLEFRKELESESR